MVEQIWGKMRGRGQRERMVFMKLLPAGCVGLYEWSRARKDKAPLTAAALKCRAGGASPIGSGRELFQSCNHAEDSYPLCNRGKSAEFQSQLQVQVPTLHLFNKFL